MLQGPAPPPKSTNNLLIFTSKYISNYSHEITVHQINNLLKNTKSERLNEIFADCSTMLAHKQPDNLLRLITKAAFNTSNPSKTNEATNGLHKSVHPPWITCKLCELYIQECTSFRCSNGKVWEIKSRIDCHSENVLYYLKCLWCPDPEDPETYTGKTNVIRDRMNNHISSCRNGNSTDIFDKHVYACRKRHGPKGDIEPFFHIYAFYTIKNVDALETHERNLHKQGLDTMNRPR